VEEAMSIRAVAAFALGLVTLATPPRACTTFCFEHDGGLIFGKNYDWAVGDGLVVVNKRGVAKRSFTNGSTFGWTSRFGSITFNQYGREFPSGGINEEGLVIELMWLDDTEYPAPDERAALPNLQWIQYQLDNAATVDEVIASDRNVRMTGRTARIHFLVADASGNTAALEYLGGKMVVHHGENMPYRALTNDTYQRSADYARTFNSVTHEMSRSSLDRFAVSALTVTRGIGADVEPVDAAFDLLARVSQGEYTQWSIVYDIPAKRVYFRTRTNPAVRWIDAEKIDFNCASPVLVLNMDDAGAGDVTGEFSGYTLQANRALVGASFAKTEFLRQVSSRELDALARFPEETRCAP
jgi:penicillin V acylase-like amidase (Ntn superfamily)